MANPYFQFKQFTVFHDCCAMKVGTDAVLLGSWLRLEGARRLLDVGCGSGVIALMAAQRSDGEVYAVEVDEPAAMQAAENISRSPWAGRIRVECADIRTYHPEMQFDVIFSNPPYFINSLKSPKEKRTMARHADELTFDELMKSVSVLLAPGGEFSLIAPAAASEELKAAATSHLLYLSRETRVYTKLGTAAKRVLLAFRNVLGEDLVQAEELVLEESPGVRSEAYRELTADYYL